MAQSALLPANPIALYVPYWNPGDRLINFPTEFNIFFYFACTGPGGGPSTTGTVQFNAISGYTTANFISDMASVRGAGKRVILSIGGGGAAITINSLTTKNNFVQAIKDINVVLGGSGTTAVFDGIDFNNYEGVTDPNLAPWMATAALDLKAYYGADFMITSPPAAYAMPTGANVLADRLLLAKLYKEGALDWFSPQFYDPSNLNTLANKRLGLDFYNTPVTVDGVSVQIPRSYIGVGMGINNPALGYPWNDVTAYETAVDAAADFTQLIADGRAPKGGMVWAANGGTYTTFASTVAPVMTNYGGGPPPVTGYTLFKNINVNNITHIAGYSLSVYTSISGYALNRTTLPTFYQTFESGTTPWNFTSITNTGGATAAVDTTSKVIGLNSMRLQAPTAGTSTVRMTLPTELSEVFVQFRLFVPTAWAPGTSNFTRFLQFLDAAVAERLRVTLEFTNMDIAFNGTDTPGYTNTGLDMPKNSLVRVEFAYKKNATTGYFKVWLNNTTEGSPSYTTGAINTGTTNIKHIDFGITSPSEALTDSIYVDNVCWDTAFIGNRLA